MSEPSGDSVASVNASPIRPLSSGNAAAALIRMSGDRVRRSSPCLVAVSKSVVDAAATPTRPASSTAL
jgi:hypothetical protein